MPSMITKCPACGRGGIIVKRTGVCIHCSKGATPAKVEAPKPAPPPAATVQAKARTTSSSPTPKTVLGRPAR